MKTKLSKEEKLLVKAAKQEAKQNEKTILEYRRRVDNFNEFNAFENDVLAYVVSGESIYNFRKNYYNNANAIEEAEGSVFKVDDKIVKLRKVYKDGHLINTIFEYMGKDKRLCRIEMHGSKLVLAKRSYFKTMRDGDDYYIGAEVSCINVDKSDEYTKKEKEVYQEIEDVTNRIYDVYDELTKHVEDNA